MKMLGLSMLAEIQSKGFMPVETLLQRPILKLDIKQASSLPGG